MTHPTDDELEEMAQYHDWREDGDSQTAAMLRACKGFDHSDWDAISFLADHNGEAYLREMKFRKAAEQALAEMTRRRDRWKAIAEGQDFTRIYLETCAERDAHKARAEALDAKLKEAVDVMQAWKTAGPDQAYYQAVQKRNAFLTSIGDKP